MIETLVSDHSMELSSSEHFLQEGAGCPTCSSQNSIALLTAPDRFHLRKQHYRLLRCQDCRTVWQENPPSPSEMGQHYTEDYHRAIMAAGEGAAADRWRDQVKMIRRYKSSGELLDIGCSSGGFLSTMVSPSWKLHGIEMEELTAQRAGSTTGANVFVGDVMDAPFPPNTFDVITCFDVLEHVYSPRQFLGRVLEWLKPGGIYYALMPNIESWESRLFGDHWFGLELPRHISHFSPRSLHYLLTDVGFEEVCLQTPVTSYVERSAGYVYSSAVEMMGGSPTPQSHPKPISLPERAIRKGLRVSVIRPFAYLAAAAGAGPSLEAVFRKPLR